MSATTPGVTIRLAGGYYFSQVERLIRDLQPLYSTTGTARYVLDLSGLAFIGPEALAVLTSALCTWTACGRIGELSVVIPPKNKLTFSYLMRMDLFEAFEVRGLPAEGFQRKQPVGFRPCQTFANLQECQAVASSLADAIFESVPGDSAGVSAIKAALHELTENVPTHADAVAGGVAVAQYARKRREIHIAIVDMGIGVRASLQRDPRFARIADDAEALACAVRPRVTSKPATNDGYGLTFTQLMLAANQGSLLLRSGYGRWELDTNGVQQGVRPSQFPGTLVAMRASADRQLGSRAVWDMLEEAIRNATDALIRGRSQTS